MTIMDGKNVFVRVPNGEKPVPISKFIVNALLNELPLRLVY
jgi:hypothetical protein